MTAKGKRKSLHFLVYKCNYNNNLYLSIILDVYIFLNVFIELQFFNSLSRLFHILTPMADMHLSFIFILDLVLLYMAVPLRSYRLSLAWNRLWMQTGRRWLCALYIRSAVFKSTRSSSFKVLSSIKSGFVGE